MTRLRNKTRGSALIFILLLAVLILAYSAVNAAEMRSSLQKASHREKRLRAEYAAESGLQMALAELHQDDSWGSASTPELIVMNIPDSPGLQAQVTAWNNTSGGSDLTTANGTTVPIGRVYLEVAAILNGEILEGSFGHADSILVKATTILRVWIVRNFRTDSSRIRYLDRQLQ